MHPVSDIGVALLFGDREEVFSNENIRLAELLVGHSSESLKDLAAEISERAGGTRLLRGCITADISAASSRKKSSGLRDTIIRNACND